MKLRTYIMPQACFGSPQARFWRGLGASWACLRRNLDALGELLDSLGCLCAVSWPPFGCFLGALGRIWALIGASVLDFGWSWAPPGWVLASSGAVFATIFEGDALIAAGIPAWHSHWHFVTSLQRGGTCAAHGIKFLGAVLACFFLSQICIDFLLLFCKIVMFFQKPTFKMHAPTQCFVVSDLDLMAKSIQT